jgi:hypothetical protein
MTARAVPGSVRRGLLGVGVLRLLGTGRAHADDAAVEVEPDDAGRLAVLLGPLDTLDAVRAEDATESRHGAQPRTQPRRRPG